jgi:hypothetical protein
LQQNCHSSVLLSLHSEAAAMKDPLVPLANHVQEYHVRKVKFESATYKGKAPTAYIKYAADFS